MKYSRLESTEEKRNFRNAVLFGILTLLALVLLLIYGIPMVGRVASFVSGLRGGTTNTKNDKTPPAPPKFHTFVDFTNQNDININGTAEAGATVKLTFNSKPLEVLVDKDGNFNFTDIILQEGENTFSAVVIDQAENTSQTSSTRTITYDPKPPEINIESPTDGAQFYGSTQRQIDIKGVSEPNVSMTINDRVVSVDSTGKFEYPITLNAGDNTFNIKSTDLAGNITEKNITLRFSE